MSIASSSAIVSPMTLKAHGWRGARIVYQRLDFHLSRCLRAAALAAAPFAMTTTSSIGGYPVCGPCDLPRVFESKPPQGDFDDIAIVVFKGASPMQTAWDCTARPGGSTPVVWTISVCLRKV